MKPANKRDPASSIRTIIPAPELASPWEVTLQQVHEDLLAANPPFSVTPFEQIPLPSDSILLDTPLSPMEEEIFQSFCRLPEEGISAPDTITADVKVPEPEPKTVMEVDVPEVEEAAPPNVTQPRRSSRLASTHATTRPSTRASKKKATR
jgi:hypothetical protein